jgi:DNA-binding response OmpR family regulator
MKQIVVVEDDRDLLDMMQDMLTLDGYSVQTCTDSAALQTALQDLPALIILDVNLGEEDGREICRQLKLNKRTRHIPVILSSAQYKASEALTTSLADDFLAKPFNLSVFLAKVRKHLTSSSQRAM